MANDNQRKLEQRVVRAAEAALGERRYVTAVDVLVGIGWLAPSAVDRWRQGRVDHLEREVQANLHEISTAMSLFRRWAEQRELKPSETAYVARTRDRRRLRFSANNAMPNAARQPTSTSRPLSDARSPDCSPAAHPTGPTPSPATPPPGAAGASAARRPAAPWTPRP